MSRPNRLVPMLNRVIGDLTIIARAQSKHRTAHWVCRCKHGHVITYEGGVLRRFERDQLRTICRYCKPRKRPNRSYGGLINADGTPRQKQYYCGLCFGLSHRVAGRQCVGCGLPYTLEPKVKPDPFARKFADEAKYPSH